MKSQKMTIERSRKSILKAHRAHGHVQEHVRKVESSLPIQQELDRVKYILSQMVAGTSDAEKVEKYKAIAKELSTAARLTNGRVWSWRYVMSVKNGTMSPGKKFIQTVILCAQKNRCKQWFYFSRRHSVAAIYEKSILGEIIRTHLNGMGYKAITHARYVEIKRMATKKYTRKPA